MYLYHRERICFSSTLSCNKKEEKNHQTSHFEPVPLSINQATLSARAPFNQPGTLSARAPFSQQEKNSTISMLHLNFPPPHHMAWDLLLLPAPNS